MHLLWIFTRERKNRCSYVYNGKLDKEETEVITKINENPNNDKIFNGQNDYLLMNKLNLNITTALNIVETGTII